MQTADLDFIGPHVLQIVTVLNNDTEVRFTY